MEKIVVKNISKKFIKGKKRRSGALARLISLFSKEQFSDYFWILKNVSFSIPPGEIIGIIGKNGSGKTTLLRIIAGIYKPNKGEVKTDGKVIFFPSESKILKPKLTVRDNIFFVGSVFGISKKEMKKKFDKIIRFADLEDFINSKVEQLSRGMKSKLAFSIKIECVKHLSPDIILMDEIFGGGQDAEFKNKMLKKLEELINSRINLIIASHKLDLIKKYCDRVIWLHNEGIHNQGHPKKIIDHYLRLIEANTFPIKT